MNKIKNIKKQILEKEIQIKKLHLHQSSSDICNQLINSLIMEKAILKKELENMQKNPIIECFKNTFKKPEKLICDYFKS